MILNLVPAVIQITVIIFVKVNGKPVERAYFVNWFSQCDADEANDKCYLLVIIYMVAYRSIHI